MAMTVTATDITHGIVVAFRMVVSVAVWIMAVYLILVGLNSGGLVDLLLGAGVGWLGYKLWPPVTSLG